MEEHSGHGVSGLQHWDVLLQEPGVRVEAVAHWCDQSFEDGSCKMQVI